MLLHNSAQLHSNACVCEQASEATRAAQTSREQVVELQMAAQAKDKENAKLWEQVQPSFQLFMFYLLTEVLQGDGIAVHRAGSRCSGIACCSGAPIVSCRPWQPQQNW